MAILRLVRLLPLAYKTSILMPLSMIAFRSGLLAKKHAHKNSSFCFIVVFFMLFLTSSTTSAQVTEDFESGVATGWTTSGTASTGTFVVANPTLETTSGVTTQLEDDHTPSPGVNAYFTATNSSAGNADVDGGVSITTSPVYNIASTSQLSIWYFFGQRDNGDDSGDFFRLEYSLNSGSTYTTLVSIGDVTTNAAWTEATASIPAGSNVVIRVSVSDGTGGGDIIEGGIDDLSITPLTPTISIDDVSVDEDAGTATFTATHTLQSTGGPFTVNYTTVDGSAIAPADYTSQTGTLSFNGTIGDTEQITITINDDFTFEGDETFSIQFTSSSDGTVNISDTGTGTILDDESDPNTTRPYEERYAMNLQGNFLMRGNTNLQCVASCPGTPTTNNPSVVMGYADVDADGTTVNSSSSNFTIPAGATVEWAGLYWGGMYNSSNSGITNPGGALNIDQVKFQAPGAVGYSTINAQVRNIETVAFSGWNTFMSYADVTSMVQAGGSGTYFVADIALATGSSFTGPHGGWNMVVIYSDPTEKTRRISTWDGFQFFGFGANDNFTVTGLLTPGTGAFETHAGYYGMDGEASSSGDFVSINGTALANALNPNNNTLNGTISEFGVDVGGRNPNFGYSWGVDVDVFDASGTVPNSATSLNVVLGSSSEGIWGGVFVVSNEIAFPAVSSKTFGPTSISQGDEATVTLIVDNPAQGVNLTNLTLTDNLPSGMTISATPNATSSCGGSISAVPGASSFSVSGVSLNAGNSCTLTFDVVTDDIGTYNNTLSPSDITNDQNIPLAGETTGTLTVTVRSVITNKKITYRVNQ
ncbi:MAG: Calx-beta domain-containing protein [Flavobacteriaceae bacterium]